MEHPASEAPQMHVNPDGTTRPETEDERIARIKQRAKLQAQMKKITETAAAAADRTANMPSNLYSDYRPADKVLFTDGKGDHHSARVVGRDGDDILITIEDADSTLDGVPPFYVGTNALIMIERGAGHGPAFEPAARHQPAELDAEELFAGILIGRETPLPDATVAIQRLHTAARIPAQAKHGDAGYDLHSIEDTTVLEGTRAIIGTGIAVAIPHGFVGYIKPRSGLAAKRGIDVLGGVIDSGYRGEIKVILLNTGVMPFAVSTGDRIAQLVIQPVASFPFVETDTLPESDRAAGGFGSTGQ